EGPVDEARLADVRDAAVDDDAGIEDLVTALRTRGAEQTDQARRLQPLAVLRAKDQTEVRQHEQDEAVEELHLAVAGIGPEQSGADRARQAQADGAADQRPDDARDRRLAEAALEKDDKRRKDKRETDIGRKTDREWMKHGRGVSHRRDEERTR